MIEKMQIVWLDPHDLKPYEKNARKHTGEDVGAIRASIREFGFNDPIGIWSDDNLIVEGHGRQLAAIEEGMEKVPCIRLDHLTDEQRRAYALAHNRTAENSDWDFGVLNLELAGIREIDMSAFGFEPIPEPEPEPEVIEDEVPEEVETRCKQGDLWKLGNHRLICGDSTDVNVIARLMDGVKADMVFTDPPYNVDIVGGVSRFAKDKSGGQRISNDSFGSDEEAGEKLWRPAFTNMIIHANDCCAIYVTMPQGGTHMMMMMMMRDAGWKVKHELIWRKNSIVLGRQDYNYQHEPICYGWNKTHKFYGKGKFHTTSVWEFDRPTKSKEHPTMKPIELISECLLNSSEKGDVVLDVFGGSGSTMIACEQLCRTCYMCELDSHYCDVIIERWEKLTGEKAELMS